jgi:hypothetical protein
MKIGLDLVNWKKIPSDSSIHVPGRNIKKELITVDVSAAELMLARSLGCDAVIAHHPIGISALSFLKSLADISISWSKWAFQNVRPG